MAKKKLSKFAAISMAAAMMLTAMMPTAPVFAAEESSVCNHLETEKKVTKEPTCTKDGMYDEVCSICGITLEKGLTYRALGHSFTKADIGKGKYKCPANRQVLSLICERCGKTERFKPTDTNGSCGHKQGSHKNVRLMNVVDLDCEHDGYTGDTVCLDCGKVIKEGRVLPHRGHHFVKGATIEKPTCTQNGKGVYYCENCGKKKIRTFLAAHTWDKGEIILAPTSTAEGKKKFTCEVCGMSKEETLAKLSIPVPVKNDDTKKDVKFIINGNAYKITKENEEVRFIKAKKNAKTVIIPATVTNKGVTYKVTSIAAKAVKNNKKVRSVVIGVNVKSISNNAFVKCPALKKVNIKSTLLTKETASKKALKGVNKKLTVKVPKKVKKEYKKIFEGLKIK